LCKMSKMLTIDDLAKYPFLEKSAMFIEGRQLSLTDLASQEYSMVVRRAFERVKKSIEGEDIITDSSDPEVEIFSYPLALALVYSSKISWLVNRFATSEAKRCEDLLKMEPAPKLVEIGSESFGWKVEQSKLALEWEKMDFKLGVSEYLEAAPQFHSAAWKIINKHVDRGSVYLTSKDFARLLSENLKLKIIRKASNEEVKKFEMPEVFRPLREEILKLAEGKKQYFEDEVPAGLVDEARPPCIVAMINDMSAGKSLSHMARFTITTFMINVGEGVDDVMKLFGNVADFDEGKARYQVEHIAGIIGSKTKYKPPKCEVLRSFGLCVSPDRLCSKIHHPLSYYKTKLKSTSAAPKKDSGTGVTKAA